MTPFADDYDVTRCIDSNDVVSFLFSFFSFASEGDGDDVSAVEPSIAMDEVASSDGSTAVESGKKKKRTKRKAKNDELGKPPGAPKRFKR